MIYLIRALTFCLIVHVSLGARPPPPLASRTHNNSKRPSEHALEKKESLAGVTALVGSTLAILGTALQLHDEPHGDHVDVREVSLADIKHELMAMDPEWDKVILGTHHEKTIKEYYHHVEKLHNLNLTMQNFIANPNNNTKNKLKEECTNNTILDFIAWANEEVSRKGAVIQEVITKNYDPADVKQWRELIFSRMRQSIFSFVFCLGVSEEVDGLVNKTMLGTNNKTENGMAHTLRTILVDLDLAFEKKEEYVKENYAKGLRNIVLNFARANTRKGNEEFATNLQEHLQSRFPWKCWVVAVFASDHDLEYESRSDNLYVSLLDKEHPDIDHSVFVLEVEPYETFGQSVMQCHSHIYDQENFIYKYILEKCSFHNVFVHKCSVTDIFKLFKLKCNVHGKLEVIRKGSEIDYTLRACHANFTGVSTRFADIGLWEQNAKLLGLHFKTIII